jgi:transcriptional repressor NrdR
VPRAEIDETLSRVAHKVRALGEREISSRAIGELVMEELRQLDEVAYVRFASVYRHFEDVEAFHEEIRKLRSRRDTAPRGPERKRSPRRAQGPERDQLPLLPPEPTQSEDDTTGPDGE